ncbi:MAG: tryptophan synthase subunit alpha [Porticoccaceae bacterium]|nr:tryptophan synthase subunit alpha [Pseudomonadales bacterium]MCP5171736.1 tryptophan synthase subunit alpha [Pseudomonadales bacterium]
MNRINQCLKKLASQGRKALIPYIVVGDPSLDVTLATMQKLVAEGADILELGVAFSDPTAEGPVIQRAHERALAKNTSLRDALSLVAEFRKTDSITPVVLMGYTNPIERMGYSAFVENASRAGVDGVLTVDLPPEEAEGFTAQLRAAEIENIFLITPTTTIARQKKIVSLAGGYLYYVSLKGVTGAGNLDVNSVKEKLKEIKTLTDLPVCVGFGIKDAQSAAAVADLSDGVVIGSVLVDKMSQMEQQGCFEKEAIAAAVSAIISEIRCAIDA